MKVRVLIHRKGNVDARVAVSDAEYEIESDLDDQIACALVLDQWRRDGGQARFYDVTVQPGDIPPEDVEAVCIPAEQ